ncbi:hypothetical protein Tco_1369474 [Tanacetum coccineum]
MNVSPIPTSRIHTIHPSTLILGDPQSAVQTRSKATKRNPAEVDFVHVRLLVHQCDQKPLVAGLIKFASFDIHACPHLTWKPTKDLCYAGANLDRKLHKGDCQYFWRRLFLGNAKADHFWYSTTKAEYVAAANCCGQDIKIPTDENEANLLTKALEVSRFHEVIDFLGEAPSSVLTVQSQKFPLHLLTILGVWKITPLFAFMLVQPTEDEGAISERPSEAQPTPSPPHPSEATVEPRSDSSPKPSPSTYIPDSIPESSDGNQGGHSSSDKSLSGNEGDMTLQSDDDLCSFFCVPQEARYLKEKLGCKEFVSKGEDVCQRTRDVVNEEKENADAEVSTEDVLSTAQQKLLSTSSVLTSASADSPFFIHTSLVLPPLSIISSY